MVNAINVQGLNKAYDLFQLKDVGFTLPEGSIMGFVGGNGAGKSTTIKAMLNIIHKDSGTIELLGREMTETEKDLKEQIGVVFDESCFHDALSVKEVSLIMKNIFKTWDEPLFFNYIKRFELPEKKPVKELSRGMKMKLSIAAALAHHPKLLILDEATSGLDPIVRNQMLDIFLEFIQKEDHSVLMSSHITSDLEKICDYITFIHKGEIVFTMAKDELKYQFGIAKCTKEEFLKLGKNQVVSYKENMFGIEMLVKNKEVFEKENAGMVVEPTTIEDVMLYYVEGTRT